LRIKKAVVGSFPILPLAAEEAIRNIIDVQLKIGIDIVSDGEQRADMINYFEQIPGLAQGPKGLMVNSKIFPPENPSDFIKVRDFLFAKNHLREKGRDNATLKTAITGPITLGVTCATSGLRHYSGLNDMRLYSDLSGALEQIVVELLNLGSFVQLDEPGLSAGYMAPSKALPILEDLFRRLSNARKMPGTLGIHICGSLERVPKLLEGLLELDLDFISLAFSGTNEKQNIDLLSESLFEKSEKRLGIGSVAVSTFQKEQVENAEKIYQRIRMVADRVGKENVAYAHPDCGLKGTPLEVSELILRNLSGAVDRYNSA
jgi:5-methyltetrahydropteroyltriglutamate--homocysteine methyltransferase